MLDQLAAEVDRLCETDPATLADAESVQELHRLCERLEAVRTRATAAYDASGDWAEDGALSLAAWLAASCHRPSAQTKREVRLGRALRHMPLVEEAWLAGDICEAHVGLMVRARQPRREKAFERDEEQVVALAVTTTFAQFQKRLRYWCWAEDRDGAEKEAEAQRDQRAVHLSESFEGMFFGDLTLDPVSGAIVSGELRRLEQQCFEEDWAEARARLGEDATQYDLARTPAQRRADALVEMARRSGAMPAGSRMPAPLFTVLVGYETFAGAMCELANGSVVTPGTLAPWIAEADVERVVFDSPSRVIDVGVRRRLFTGATRRAIEVRDRECFDPYCEAPADRCQVDHIVPWSESGLTVQDNGRLACPKHNRNRHRRT